MNPYLAGNLRRPSHSRTCSQGILPSIYHTVLHQDNGIGSYTALRKIQDVLNKCLELKQNAKEKF